MGVEFLLGKSKSKKSKYIYECIDKDIKNNRKVVLFVPSQIRLLVEEQYMKELDLDGIIGVNITTINSYIEDKLKELNLHFDEKRLNKMDKKILLEKTLKENDKILNVFKKVKNKQGFIDMLYMYMDIFRKENVNTTEIKNIELTDNILKNKLNELLNIYEKYSENILSKYTDSVSEIDTFIQNAKGEEITDIKIYFDGYNNFTNSELKLIDFFINEDVDIKISINTDIFGINDINNSQSIFEVSNKTYMKLINICKKRNIEIENKLFDSDDLNASYELKYLRDNLFLGNINKKIKANDNIVITIENNIYSEVENIAINILKHVHNGYSFNDFCIYTTNLEEYEHIIDRTFSKYNIPYFLDTKKVIKNFKLTLYITKLLNLIVNQINYEDVIDIFKLGLNDIDINEVCELENYIYEFGKDKVSIKKELKENNSNIKNNIYDLEKLNKLRIKILEIFEPMISLKNQELEVKDIIKELYNHLTNNNIFKNYEELITKNSDIDENFANSISFYEQQVWSKITQIFDSIYKIYKDEKITLKEFLMLFNEQVQNLTLKSIPPNLDKVDVLDINLNKTNIKKIAFFIGVNENKFPKKIDEDLFFSDFDIQKLENKDINFKESSISKANMAMYNIYEALSNIFEKLYISILSSDISGKALRPSSLITSIRQILDVEIVGNIASNKTEDIKDIFSKEDLFTYFIQKLKDSKVEELKYDELNELCLIYDYLKNDEKYKEVLQYKKKDSNLNEQSINLIFPKEVTTSISKLELFKKCPFSYLMKYSLNISERVEYEISTLDTGSFMHEVLDSFSTYLLENNIYWQEIIDENEILKDEYYNILYNIINKKIDSIFKKHKDNIKFNILKLKLINTMKNVVIVIAKGFNQSEFTPYGYEIEFKDGGIFTPITIDIDENRRIKLIGKIDRVDVLKLENAEYIRVVDYKSSSRSLDIDNIKEGISLQLICYLRAFINNYKQNNKDTDKVIPAACVYFNLSNNLVNLSTYMQDENQIKAEVMKSLRMKGIFLQDLKVIEKMDKKLDDSYNRVLDVAKSSLNKEGKKVLSEENFTNLCNETDNILKDIAKQVLDGVVKIEPNRKENYCKYCKYMCICRKKSKL